MHKRGWELDEKSEWAGSSGVKDGGMKMGTDWEYRWVVRALGPIKNSLC